MDSHEIVKIIAIGKNRSIQIEIKKASLIQHPESALTAMFGGGHPVDIDDEGYIVVKHRNHVLFNEMIEYLKTGKLSYDNIYRLNKLREEFSYWDIPFPRLSKDSNLVSKVEL